MAYRDSSRPDTREIPYGPLSRLLAEWIPLWVFVALAGLLAVPLVHPINPDADSGVVWVLLLLLLVPCFFLGRFLYRMPTRVSLEHDPAARTLRVVTRRMIFLRDERTVSVDGVGAVLVDWGRVKRWVHHSQRGADAPGDLAARLVLRYRDGEEAPVTDRKLIGTTVHDDAAAALREELGLAPQPRTFAPPAKSKFAKWHLALALGVPLSVLAVGGAMEWAATSGTVGLHIQAETQCRFQGMDLLRGGEVTMRLEPGTYTVEVADPEAPGGWRRDRFELAEGDDRRFVCR